ncbi:chemotaxis protein CheW [Pelotomaculum terephthalicicum JT]|uniref:chemotaxis protein CheW n=1 Tax=Pelotomaculum TaxID=191373 RepID=UPI0009CD1E70|nr:MULTISPECIES: chemotaxis protein CheW [Pelotomaculum]MCG9967682.1 chemotaxis protein CheW [Pelotomaculum terephthalicicum JT]OPX84024.1 MAG: Chemotaxis protein CheW [Pelotomaculum sp. PtaB.Bin117]OPY61486.1 MAG: Chemotaxis protein CheW [Pelotomaculum sp. PtaU1.Bin065]
MNSLNRYVTFKLEERLFGLYLSHVERIIRAVEVTPLPQAPEVVLGVINMQGRIIPVVNIRNRFGLPCREISLSDHFIIANTSRRTIALVADAVGGVVERPEQEVIAAGEIMPGIEYVESVIKLEDGMIMILDLGRLLFHEEEQALNEVIKEI